MTKITIKMVLMLSVVAVLVVGICGCTSVSNPLATSSDNRAVDYGNAFVKLLKAEPGNQTVTDSKVVANGSDAAQLTVVMENRTVNKTSILWQNGTRTTMSFNIKSCGSTDAATTVTMYFSYNIASKGNAASSLGAGEGVYQWNIATLNNQSLSGTKALTHTGFVFEVFRYWGTYPAITGGAGIGLSPQTAAGPGVETGAGQASGSVFIYAIVLEFPQTAG
jgi:hypothetical protein